MDDGRDPSGQALAVPATPASAVDGPSGFDPSRGGSEMLAILLWDYFGPMRPRSLWQVEQHVPKASPGQVEEYRKVAESMAETLRYWRNQ